MTIRQFTPPVYTPPFSHTPGIQGWLAGSPFVVRLFPTAFELYEVTLDTLLYTARFEFPDLHAPKDWTVFFDVLHHAIVVQGRSDQSFFRFRISATADGVILFNSSGNLRVVSSGETILQKGESLTLVALPCEPPSRTARLLLGCNKAPLWERVRQHPSMLEVMPYWFQLGTPTRTLPFFDTPSLLTTIIDSIRRTERKGVSTAFETFFTAATHGFFVPKKVDDLFLGLHIPLLPKETSLIEISSIIASSIRALFIQESSSCVTFLPCLPEPFLSGRLLQERLSSGHLVDFEWRKGKLRRLVIQPQFDDTLTFFTPGNIFASLRSLRKGERKKRLLLGEPLHLQKNEHLLVDNFSS